MEPEPHYEDFRSLRRKIFNWQGGFGPPHKALTAVAVTARGGLLVRRSSSSRPAACVVRAPTPTTVVHWAAWGCSCAVRPRVSAVSCPQQTGPPYSRWSFWGPS